MPQVIVTEQGEPSAIPNTYVPLSPTGATLIAAMQPWISLHLAWYLDAVGSMFDGTAAVVFDVGVDGQPGYIAGYGGLLDPRYCPPANLPYLGQFVGVPVPVGQDAATALALVTAEAGLARGTLGAIQSAIVRSISNPWTPNTALASGVMVYYGNPAVYYLTTAGFTTPATFNTTNLSVVNPASQYTLIERQASDGSANAYAIYVRVKPAQLTPVSDTTALTAAINLVKPGGILVTIVATNSPTWSAATLAWNAVAGTVKWSSVASGQV